MRKFILLLLATVLIGGTVYVYGDKKNTTGDITGDILNLSVSIPQRNVPRGWKEYRNSQYKFSLLHPTGLSVSERFEVGGAITIVFQNTKEQKGFQIFIVPYKEDQISEERFKKDVPSGVRTQVEEVSIDGVPAVAFYSKDTYLGDMREVWFIANGFLYEVVTIKSYERTLSDILLTLIFTK